MTSLRFVAVGLTILSLPGLAQQAPTANPVTSDIRGAWGYMMNVILRAAEKMPEENYAFKPVPEVRSFGQIVGHIADGQLSVCAAVKGVARPDVRVEKAKTTKAELIAALKEADAFCNSVLTDLTDAKVMEPVKLYGQERSGLSALYGNAGHNMEHYGNLVTYLRIKGLVPPSSEPRPAPKAK